MPPLGAATSGTCFAIAYGASDVGCAIGGASPTETLERYSSASSFRVLDLNENEAVLGSMLLKLKEHHQSPQQHQVTLGLNGPSGLPSSRSRLDDDDEEPFGVSESDLQRTMAFMGQSAYV
jgi:hypothetical protein